MVWHSLHRRRALALAPAVVVVVALACPAGAMGAPVPALENVNITSFDGTQIDANFYPAAGLQQGQSAPTVLDGSFWGLPAYPSWLGTVTSLGVESFQIDTELLGPATLTAAGYNVVTWNARGWYSSGGQINDDSPSYEGRDVTAIINWLATQSAAELKGPNYPVVGMTGFSYGAGVQLSTAVNDHRLAAIEPNASWYSLAEVQYPNQVIKAGWGDILCAVGVAVLARYAPEQANICASTVTGPGFTPSEGAFAEAASPGPLIKQITTPTLLLAGTVDTLFPINTTVATYNALRAAGTPVKMMWYCGGHGICNQSLGPNGHVAEAQLTFLNKYLKTQNVSTGPGFEYLDQTGTWRSASSYPVASTGQLTASGSGTLPISPLDTSGLLGIEATKALNGVSVQIPAPSTSVETLTDPTLSLTYHGLATKAETPIFAQVVDNSTGRVLDNQATAVPLVLNGATHTLTLPLNMVTWNLTPSSRISLQLTDASDLFFAQQAIGLASLQAKVTLATSPPGPSS